MAAAVISRDLSPFLAVIVPVVTLSVQFEELLLHYACSLEQSSQESSLDRLSLMYRHREDIRIASFAQLVVFAVPSQILPPCLLKRFDNTFWLKIVNACHTLSIFATLRLSGVQSLKIMNAST